MTIHDLIQCPYCRATLLRGKVERQVVCPFCSIDFLILAEACTDGLLRITLVERPSGVESATWVGHG
jgi:hypothetical protein